MRFLIRFPVRGDGKTIATPKYEADIPEVHIICNAKYVASTSIQNTLHFGSAIKMSRKGGF